MSRGQKARTPWNFPRMKPRAHQRRVRRTIRMFERLGDGDYKAGFGVAIHGLTVGAHTEAELRALNYRPSEDK